MTIETEIYAALKSLVNSRVYQFPAPPTLTLAQRQAGYITHQQVGGRSWNFLEGGSVGIHAPRIQLNVWHANKESARTLSRQAEAALRGVASLQTEVLGEAVDTYDVETQLCGTMQDFMVVG